MLNVYCATSKCCQEVDLRMVEQVIVLSLESRMRLLFDFELHVARKHSWHLITFAPEINLVAGFDASVDMHVQHFSLHNRLLPHASFAPVLVADDLAVALAVGADGLESLDHRAHLPH